MRVNVKGYRPCDKTSWDDFIAHSKNGVFLFFRDYMEYHADRFTDASLLFLDENEKLIAVMPASVKEGVLSSHAGLTFGGIVSDAAMKMPLMLDVFAALNEHLLTQSLTKLIYKAVPHIYHRLPAEEDLYALFRHQARLTRRDVSSVVAMSNKLAFSKGRRYAIKQSRKFGVGVGRSYGFEAFMAIEKYVLGTKYDVAPVHTAQEIQLLAARFPENIKLFAAHKEMRMLAGVIVYESETVAHAQYIAADDEGKNVGALDSILDFLINDYYAAKSYFDFGISTEQAGQYLNAGLIENKQSFGGRAVVYDFYEMNIGGN